MKYILKRDKFINEAKLRDVLLNPQIKRVKAVWGEKYLDYEEIEATTKINQGKWKLSQEDYERVLNKFFNTNINFITSGLDLLSANFVEACSYCLDINNSSIITNANLHFSDDFNIKHPKMSELSGIYFPVFNLINANETRSDSKIERDSSGKPVRDADNNIKKVDKPVGEIVFSNNYGNINKFVSSYNSAFPNDKVEEDFFSSTVFSNINNIVEGAPGVMDFDLFGKHDMYLLIEHNPSNILNISVSKFFKSCQELYTGGGHGENYLKGLLINVFDPNTIPAYLIFDTPYYNYANGGKEKEKLSDFLPISRLLIRSLESFNESDSTKLYFDATYPHRMEDITRSLIERLSGNILFDDYDDYDEIGDYYFIPDIEMDDFDKLSEPYMDNLSIRRGYRIGKNTKKLYLSPGIDWENIIIDKGYNNIEELIIETDCIPKNFFNIKLNLKWVKFKKLEIKDLSVFTNILTDSIAFHQCKVNNNFIKNLFTISPDLRSLSLSNMDTNEISSLKMFTKLEELELIYTISQDDDLEQIVIENTNLKKLTISGDLLGNKKTREYIKTLKGRIKVEIKGLVL